MKMKKMIPILIGIVIVAAAAFFFLKKKSNTQAATSTIDEGESTSNAKFLDINSTDSIVDNLSLSSDLKKKAKGWVKEISNKANNKSGGWDREKLENSAKDKGITYAQQLVTSALWQMYETAKVLSRDQFNTYYNELVSFGE